MPRAWSPACGCCPTTLPASARPSSSTAARVRCGGGWGRRGQLSHATACALGRGGQQAAASAAAASAMGPAVAAWGCDCRWPELPRLPTLFSQPLSSGTDVKLVGIKVNGEALAADAYELESNGLTLKAPPAGAPRNGAGRGCRRARPCLRALGLGQQLPPAAAERAGRHSVPPAHVLSSNCVFCFFPPRRV